MKSQLDWGQKKFIKYEKSEGGKKAIIEAVFSTYL